MFHPQFVFQFGLSWNKISKRLQKLVTGHIIDLFMFFLELVISIQIISHELIILISRFTFCRKAFYAYFFLSFLMSKAYYKIKRHEIYKWFSNKFQNIHCRNIIRILFMYQVIFLFTRYYIQSSYQKQKMHYPISISISSILGLYRKPLRIRINAI